VDDEDLAIASFTRGFTTAASRHADRDQAVLKQQDQDEKAQ
jgi:hypothetical protein